MNFLLNLLNKIQVIFFVKNRNVALLLKNIYVGNKLLGYHKIFRILYESRLNDKKIFRLNSLARLSRHTYVIH